MAANKIFGNTGLANISTANANLDGTGPISAVITGALSGTSISTITVKALGSTSEGMVRLFINDGSNTSLYKEIPVPASVQSSVEKSFEVNVSENLVLNSGYTLYASTQNSDSFTVMANSNNWDPCPCSGTCDCGVQQMTATVGNARISAANPNLDGSGPITAILTSPTGTLAGGTSITRINVKAIESTPQGMVRLFIMDGGGSLHLFTEIPIAASVVSPIEPAFRAVSEFRLFLEPGATLYASTETGTNFNVTTFALNIINCDC